MRSFIYGLLICLASAMPLCAQESPTLNQKGSGPGGWLGMQLHDKYLGLSIGYPWVQRGGRSLGLHVGIGGYSGSESDNPYPEGLKDKSGLNLGLYVGGNLFCAAGVERMKRTDAHRVFTNYRTSSFDTSLTRTSGYFLVGYRSWPGLGIYVQGGTAIGVGLGVSLQL